MKSPSLTLFIVLALPALAPAQDPHATAEELGLMQGFPPPDGKRVTQANALMTPPFNRWSYQNMRMFYPTATIPAAEEEIALKKAPDESFDAIQIEEPKADKRVDLASWQRKTFTDALVVIDGDTVVYENYLNGMDANRPHQMMSCTKSFGGLLAMMAVESGKLAEDDRVTKYVPELERAGAFADATVGQVLDMTNSMDLVEDYADPRSGIRQYTAVLGWTEPVEGIEYPDTVYDFLVKLDAHPDRKHGEAFYYQTPKTDVVNWFTNRASGRSFQKAMYEDLWSKLGTEGDTYILLDKGATPVVGGGLNATPDNLARFAIMMINGGKFEGEQVVSPGIIKKIAKGASTEAFDKGPDSDGYVYPKGEWSYRAQWWVRHTPGKEAFTAIGVHGQWIYLDVKRKIAVIKQSSQPISDDPYQNKFNLNAFDALVKYARSN